MELHLEEMDIKNLAASVVDAIRPLLLAEFNDQCEKPTLTAKGLSEYLDVPQSWIYRQVQLKAIPHFHLGKYLRFNKAEIDLWIKEQKIPATVLCSPKHKQ